MKHVQHTSCPLPTNSNQIEGGLALSAQTAVCTAVSPRFRPALGSLGPNSIPGLALGETRGSLLHGDGHDSFIIITSP